MTKTVLLFAAFALLTLWMSLPVEELFSVKGACVVVTGGSYGVGPVIAGEMAGQSAARLVLIARGREKLESQASVLRSNYPGTVVDTVVADFLDPEATAKAVANATGSECPGPWVLVNNAALAQARSFLDYSTEDMENVFKVNVLTPFRVTQQMLQIMREQGKGHVVFVSSLQAMYSHPYMSVYAASKASITNFAKSVRGELFHAGLTNITMNVVNVGPIREAGAYDAMNLTVHEWYGSSAPRDVARAVVSAVQRNSGSTIVNSSPFLPWAILDLLLSGRSWEVQARFPGTPALPILEQYQRYAANNPVTIVSKA